MLQNCSFLSRFENLVYPWSHFHQHPTAGGFMAAPFHMHEVMTALMRDHNTNASMLLSRVGTVVWDDQLALRKLHRERWGRTHLYPVFRKSCLCQKENHVYVGKEAVSCTL